MLSKGIEVPRRLRRELVVWTDVCPASPAVENVEWHKVVDVVFEVVEDLPFVGPDVFQKHAFRRVTRVKARH